MILIGFSKSTAKLIANLTTVDGYLAAGFSTSTTIANLIFYDLDSRISGITTSYNFEYSRYGDDIILSGEYYPMRLIKKISTILLHSGFRIQYSKSKILTQHESRIALGLNLNIKVNPSRATRKRLRAICNNCYSNGINSQIPTGSSREEFIARIVGQIYYYKFIYPTSLEVSEKKFKAAIDQE